jgi:transketolase
MRTAFIQALSDAAVKDKRIFLLTGDLGYGVLEPFQKSFPDQYLNCGVAEQNMVGIAAGLALAGKIPIVYSIATFATMRCYEQIRNDVCYQNLNVKIVGVGAGLTYSQYGATHNAMEDISIMRSLPNMTVIAPGDPKEVQAASYAMFKHHGPCYLRIAARGEPSIHTNIPKFEIGKGILVQDGKDIAFISTGHMLENVVKAAALLKEKGISTRIISMHTIKPLDRKLLQETMQRVPYLFTVEDHSIIGGLGSAVAEVVAETGYAGVFKRIAPQDAFQKVGGWLPYIRNANGLSVEAIADTVQLVRNAKKHT